MPKKTEPENKPEIYAQNGNLEAHIIADMLRIESITSELREFKEVTRDRLNKLENWIVAIVGVTVTTLIATVGGLVFRVLGGS
jgi:hypothetical protein